MKAKKRTKTNISLSYLFIYRNSLSRIDAVTAVHSESIFGFGHAMAISLLWANNGSHMILGGGLSFVFSSVGDGCILDTIRIHQIEVGFIQSINEQNLREGTCVVSGSEWLQRAYWINFEFPKRSIFQ